VIALEYGSILQEVGFGVSRLTAVAASETARPCKVALGLNNIMLQAGRESETGPSPSVLSMHDYCYTPQPGHATAFHEHLYATVLPRDATHSGACARAAADAPRVNRLHYWCLLEDALCGELGWLVVASPGWR